jgi:hypothetical protein
MATKQSLPQKIRTTLRNPTVQKLLAWGLPMLFGWILSKLDNKSDDQTRKK